MAFSDAEITQNLANLGFSEEQIEIGSIAADFCAEKSPMDKVQRINGQGRRL